MLHVELVYAPKDKPLFHCQLNLAPGSTVLDALQLSGVYGAYPETQSMAVGIFAKVVNLETLLRPGDRIEIYRPLLLDPKEKRRQRAQHSK